MIVKPSAPIVPIQRVQSKLPANANQTPQAPIEQKQQIELKANNSQVGSDPFVQQMRTITDEALQSNVPFEAYRSENNRVRTGLEAKTQETLENRPYNQLFSREQNTARIENSPRKDLELPPAERQYNGREKEGIDKSLLQDENAENFSSYEEYAPKPAIDLDLGFYRHETEIEKLDALEQDISKYTQSLAPPPSTRAAFSQPQDEDYKHLPQPKREMLAKPIPPPLKFSEEQKDYLNNSTTRSETDGAQPPQQSAQATLRTFDDTTKSPKAIPDTPISSQLQQLEPKPASLPTPSTPPPTVEPPPQPNVTREAPVTETSESNETKGSFDQLTDLLSGNKQLRREDQVIIGEGT